MVASHMTDHEKDYVPVTDKDGQPFLVSFETKDPDLAVSTTAFVQLHASLPG